MNTKNKKRHPMLWSILSLSVFQFLSCIADAPILDLGVSNKIMIIGFVGTHTGPAQIKIQQSVGINTKEKYIHKINNGTVVLVESNPFKKLKSYHLKYNLETDLYMTEEIGIARKNHGYHIEVTINQEKYISDTIQIITPSPKIKLTQENVSNNPLDTNTYSKINIEVEDAASFQSYIIKMNNRFTGLDIAEALKTSDFYDSNYREGNPLRIEIDFFKDYLTGGDSIYLVQIPNEVTDFFRDWIELKKNESDDFFGQIFGTTPATLKNNFKTVHGSETTNIIGVFFPANSLLIPLNKD